RRRLGDEVLQNALLRNVVERLGVARGTAAVRFRYVIERRIGGMLGEGVGGEQVGAAAGTAVVCAAPDLCRPVGRRAIGIDERAHFDDHRAGLRLVDELLLASPAYAHRRARRLHGDDGGVGGGVVGAVMAV